MKVWKFYIVEPDSKKKDIELYAITNDKHKAKAFKESRNMKIFKVIESEMDKDNYISFLNEEGYGNELIDGRLITDGVDEYDRYELKEVSFVMTRNEESVVDSTFESDLIISQDENFWKDTLPSHVFNKEIQKALRILEYPVVRHLYVNKVLGEYDTYAAPSLMPNTLNLFIQTYGRTLNL